MSVMEIPEELYKMLRAQAVARYINNGLDLQAARQMAREHLAQCFISDAEKFQCDVQKDYDDAEWQKDWTR